MAGDFDEMRRLVQQDEAFGFILSLRKIVPTFSGNAIQVRRSSDNAVQDIGFSSGVLDETALLAFVGASDGFVSKWYDQNGIKDFVQATTSMQPKIVGSGVVVKEGGKPVIDFVGGGKKLSASSGISLSDKLCSIYIALKAGNTTGVNAVFQEMKDGVNPPPHLRTVLFSTNDLNILSNHKPITADNLIYYTSLQPALEKKIICFQNSFASIYGYKNNVLQDSLLITERYGATTTISIGTQTTGGNDFTGKLFEIQAFPEFHNSTERTNKHSDMNAFYSIY